MTNCNHCGTSVNEATDRFCPVCGTPVIAPGQPQPNTYQPAQQPYQQNYAYYPPQQPAVNDNGGCGWMLLGGLVPLLGLILFLIWKAERPKTAKAAGIGALVGTILSVALTVIGVVLSIVVASAGYII